MFLIMRILTVAIGCLMGCGSYQASHTETQKKSFLSSTMTLLDGDMIVSKERLILTETGFNLAPPTSAQLTTQGNIQIHFDWGDKVPIKFEDDVPQFIKNFVYRACDEFKAPCTCYSGETAYVNVEMSGWECGPGAAACAALPEGGKTVLKLQTSNHYAFVAHELGHTLGLLHEHQRVDRDLYISEASSPIIGDVIGEVFGPFDYESVMLYPCDSIKLRDLNLCHLNGLETGRVSQLDREAIRATHGSNSLGACVDPSIVSSTSESIFTGFHLISSTGERLQEGFVSISTDTTREPFIRQPINNFGRAGFYLPQGSYYVRQEASGYDQRGYWIRVPDDFLGLSAVQHRMVPSNQVTTSKPSPILTVKVLDKHGRPLSNALVTVVESGSDISDTTNNEGLVSSPLSQGTHFGRVTFPGLSGASGIFEHYADQTITVYLN